MAATTGIEWCDATWNPHYGCRKVSQGCAKCYAERDMIRYGKDFKQVRRAAPATFGAPLTWAKSGRLAPGSRIFTCSWSDWFIKEADEWRDEAWAVVRATPQYNYLILTKRPERIAAHLPADWGAGWPNVWLGVSAERQREADQRIPILLGIPTDVRFASVEPMLGPIDLSKFIQLMPSNVWSGFGNQDWGYAPRNGGFVLAGSTHDYVDDPPQPGIHWVITGGESDPKAPRPMDLDWARAIRDQCIAAGVAYFHKQHGGSRKVNGMWGGRVLDGRTWDEFPNDTKN